MKKIALLITFVLSLSIFANENEANMWEKIKLDYKNYYVLGDYKEAGTAFLVGGIMANSPIDQWIRDNYQTKIRNNTEYGTDEINEQSLVDKTFGEGKIMIPVVLGAKFLGDLTNSKNIEEWGDNATRAYLVGVPSLLLLQRVTGGSRPAELNSDETSNWKFFNDDNGVSGHSYMGSVPFLVAANMSDDKFTRGFFYFASTLTGLSRINDDAHFASQAFLGWYLAYASVKSVFKTNGEIEKNKNELNIIPIINEDSYGLGISFKR